MLTVATACCFTGHRDITAEECLVRSRLQAALKEAVGLGYTHFLSGGALGFDLLAAEEVLALAKENPKLCLVMVLPCPPEEQTKSWPAAEKARYYAILAQATEQIVTSPAMARGVMHIRNRYLVDHSSRCLAWQERETGGTAYTVKYAVKKGISLKNLAEE